MGGREGPGRRNGKKTEGGIREERNDEEEEEGRAGEVHLSFNRAEASLAGQCDQDVSSIFIAR